MIFITLIYYNSKILYKKNLIFSIIPFSNYVLIASRIIITHDQFDLRNTL